MNGQARVVRTLVWVVAGFLLFATVAEFVLIYTDQLTPDEADQLAPLFELVSLLVGVVAGWTARGGSAPQQQQQVPPSS